LIKNDFLVRFMDLTLQKYRLEVFISHTYLIDNKYNLIIFYFVNN